MRTGKELARYMQPPLEGGRLDRQWDAVDKLTSPRSRRPWGIAFGVALAAASVIAAFLILARPPATPVVDGAIVETYGANSQPLALADGSTVTLSQSSRLQVATVRPDAVHLVLTRGALSLDVAHDAKRTFTVSAGGFDVFVRGTRFRVELSEGPAPRLSVSVTEGRVETRRSGSKEAPRAVIAGESWSTVLRAVPPANVKEAEAVPQPERVAAVETAGDDQPQSKNGVPARSESGDPFAENLKAGKYREAYDALGPNGFAREMEGANARRLFELADAARLGGHPRDAALALDKLRRAYRGDPRAGLAALELGRLRIDVFGDASGALEALQDSIALGASGSLREDAEARIVQALDRLGDLTRCARARDAYLARFPNGVHAATMRTRCGPK